MNPTSIAWVRGPDGAPGFTWNPVVGCSPCSSGCNACWAARLASTRLDHLPEYKGLEGEPGPLGTIDIAAGKAK